MVNGLVSVLILMYNNSLNWGNSFKFSKYQYISVKQSPYLSGWVAEVKQNKEK